MHEIDIKLVEDAQKQILKLKVSNKRREALIYCLEKYQTACQLSRGPDKLRSKYWSQAAKENWVNLYNVVHNRVIKKNTDNICNGV